MTIQKGKKESLGIHIVMEQYGLLGVCVILLLVVALQWSTPLSIFEKRVVTAVLSPAQHSVERLMLQIPVIGASFDLWSAQQQVAALRSEKDALFREVVMLRLKDAELLSLKGTLANIRVVPTKTITSALVLYPRALVLNGSSDGVATGNPVFSSKGLIGVIGNVAAHSATVVLLTSEQLRLPVMHQASKAQGVLMARDGVMSVTFLSLIPSIQPGDVIVSLTTIEGLRAGELIGSVSSVDTKLSDPVTKVRLQSPVFPITDTLVVIVKGGM